VTNRPRTRARCIAYGARPNQPAKDETIRAFGGLVKGIVSDSYREILVRADAHFARVRESQPSNLECRLGCTGCCHGLVEISLADVTILVEGLETIEPALRADLVARSTQIVAETAHPVLRESDSKEKAAFFRRAGEVPCPALGPRGECRIYAFRPLACRTFGLPLREGPSYRGEECELNFTGAPQEEKEAAAWDLEWEDILGPEDEFTIPEAILLAERMLGSRK